MRVVRTWPGRIREVLNTGVWPPEFLILVLATEFTRYPEEICAEANPRKRAVRGEILQIQPAEINFG